MSSIFRSDILLKLSSKIKSFRGHKIKKMFYKIKEFIIRYFGCINKNRILLMFCFFYVYTTWFICSNYSTNVNLLSGRKEDGFIGKTDCFNNLLIKNKDVNWRMGLQDDNCFDKPKNNVGQDLNEFKIDNYFDNKAVASVKPMATTKISKPEKNPNQSLNSKQTKSNKNAEISKSTNSNKNNLKKTYSKKLVMTATAYDLSPMSCGRSKSSPNYGITASGKRAKTRRTIAVDPRIIPLGTNVKIVFPAKYKYLDGVYVAEDTGGAIKGNIIDIFMGEDKPGDKSVRNMVYRFGVQKVQVEILK